MDEVLEMDVITNYHLKEILILRQELMEELMQFPIRRAIKNRTLIYENQTKCVYTGESNEFGPVVLKTDQNITQLYSEYHMLAKLNGNHSCKVYAFDADKGQLLEERILPGHKLREEASLEKRLDAFVEVFQSIHIPVVADKPAKYTIPTYLDWLEDICQYNPLPKEWRAYAKKAQEIGAELFEKYPDRVLLHGDLHHKRFDNETTQTIQGLIVKIDTLEQRFKDLKVLD